MREIYFNDRDGQTVLYEKERSGLQLKHLTNIRELDEAEQLNINEGLIWLSQQKKADYLTEKFCKRLHKKLFGSVWNWAGKFRVSEKNIGIDYWKVAPELHKLFKDTEYWIEHQSYEWPELIARFHHRLVFIHPFPNGNGRFSRILTNYLCDRNQQHRPTWLSALDPAERRKVYIDALRKADLHKFDDIVEFMRQ